MSAGLKSPGKNLFLPLPASDPPASLALLSLADASLQPLPLPHMHATSPCSHLLPCLLELPQSFDCKEIKPVNPKGNQSWIFIERTDAEAETPILSPSDAKSWLIWKDPDAGRDLGQEEKGMTEDEMASPTHWTWVWVDSWSWWWTGRPGVLQFMGLQRVGHNWATELNWGAQ